ncbi:HEAT repeat protein [Ophiocordyceps camponoti-floridani]|uniref:HEAT repeat protein n=1 Tax=Ophiocordyceps camponoti-floridani TaxID=2030778 RepID=A0A8H4Q4Y7_9HYPO|nr:HEAT repeat protein [Ophiocordyceps camponoti-floridani]
MEEPTIHEAETISWLEKQDSATQKSRAAALFETLLREAKQPETASGPACVRLVGLVTKASRSESELLRCWAVSEPVALALFRFYVDWHDRDRHRAAKTVLELMAMSVKKNSDREAAGRTVRVMVENLVLTVSTRSVKPAAKSAMECLDFFLRNGVLTLDDVYATYLTQREELAGLDGCSVWRHFVSELFRWMALHFVSLSAGRLILSVYRLWRRGETQAPDGPDLETWFRWLADFALGDATLVEPIRNYILVPLFKDDGTEGMRFLKMVNDAVGSLDLSTTVFQLATLESGKRAGLVDCGSAEEGNGSDGVSPLIICPNILDGFLAHPDERVRILALSLLVTSPSTTSPYSVDALHILRTHLGSLFSEPNAKVREETSAKLRDMYRRLCGAIHALKRDQSRLKDKSSAGDGNSVSQPVSVNHVGFPCMGRREDYLKHHVEFHRAYLTFLCHELVPTASYQRHIASLKAVNSILRMEKEAKPFWKTEEEQVFLNSFDDKWARALFDLLMDPFHDVRGEAAKALGAVFGDARFQQPALGDSDERKRMVDSIVEVSRRAEEMARRTARADHSDGVSKAQQLLYRSLSSGEDQMLFLRQKVDQLARKVSAAESHLGRAVLQEPLHGDLASLNRLWQVVVQTKLPEYRLVDVTALQSDLASLCERLWTAVRDVLCFDSPEGHLPQDLEDIEGLETKSLLSFSFRAVNEASNLLRTVVLTARNRGRVGFVAPSEEVFGRIGGLAFDQLANLRHRGALTTVGLLFAAFCQQARNMGAGLDGWYQGTIKLLFSFTSTTRRSAGLPIIVTGILSANTGPPFREVMDRLISIASEEVQVSETASIPQVHAYNCLRDIFKVSTCGRPWEVYLSPCLRLAASGLRSETWAIRNSGLMLLRSLVDCLFGSHESRAMMEAGWDGKANRLAYHRYPGVADVLREVLVSGHETLESGISVLEMIRRGGPPSELDGEIEAEVRKYLACSVWQVRELAAKTLCSCLLNRPWFRAVEDLLEEALRGKNPNQVHGALLTVKAIVERLDRVAAEKLRAECVDLAGFLARSSVESLFAYCPDVVAAYLQVVDTIWAVQRANSWETTSLTPFLQQGPGSVLLTRAALMHNVYAASVEDDAIDRLRALLLNQRDVDITSILHEVAHLLHPTASDQTLTGLAELYIDVCFQDYTAEVESQALQNLVACLDSLLARNKANNMPQEPLKKLWIRLCSRSMGPAVSTEAIRLSGAMAVLNGSSALRAWGRMMAETGSDEQPLDMRLAASHALRSYFTSRTDIDGEDSLPALVALYDALGDDDDEVRDVAAEAASSLIGQKLVPIEAANRLLQWLARRLGHTLSFRCLAAHRIVNHRLNPPADWEPASQALDRATQTDDSLFLVEKQNLFTDPMRETSRWLAILRTISPPTTDLSILRLDAWLAEGMLPLRNLAGGDDGPLGWASDPRVFAVCARLVLGVVALRELGMSAVLREEVKETREVLCRRGVSKLLVGAWEDLIVD